MKIYNGFNIDPHFLVLSSLVVYRDVAESYPLVWSLTRFLTLFHPTIFIFVCSECSLHGVVVSVLVTGPKGCRFKRSQGDGFLKVSEVCSTPSFRWEVKPEVPCCEILRHVKDLLKPTGTDRLNSHFLHPFSYSLQSCLCWQDCQSALVDKFGVNSSWYHHSMVHITVTRGWIIGPLKPQFWDVSLTPSSPIYQCSEYSLSRLIYVSLVFAF
jgi:hypothetical protein